MRRQIRYENEEVNWLRSVIYSCWLCWYQAASQAAICLAECLLSPRHALATQVRQQCIEVLRQHPWVKGTSDNARRLHRLLQTVRLVQS